MVGFFNFINRKQVKYFFFAAFYAGSVVYLVFKGVKVFESESLVAVVTDIKLREDITVREDNLKKAQEILDCFSAALICCDNPSLFTNISVEARSKLVSGMLELREYIASGGKEDDTPSGIISEIFDARTLRNQTETRYNWNPSGEGGTYWFLLFCIGFIVLRIIRYLVLR